MRRITFLALLSLLFFGLFYLNLSISPALAAPNLRPAVLLNVPYINQGSASHDPSQSCGPASVAMALTYATGASVSADTIRSQTKHPLSGPTFFDDYLEVWSRYGLSWGQNLQMVYNATEFKAALQGGQVIVAALHYGQKWLGKGSDYGRAGSSPDQTTGLFDPWLQDNGGPNWGHMVTIIGFGSDAKGQEYFILNDPNDFDQPRYKYSNGTPKGKGRWLPVNEVIQAIGGMWTNLSNKQSFALAITPLNRTKAPASTPKPEANPQPPVKSTGVGAEREGLLIWSKALVDNFVAPHRISKHRGYLVF